MTPELISPNWHVVLIHVPLGVFMLGVVIELFAFLYRHSPVRAVARGMIWLGALGSLPATYSGIYAMADVARKSLPPGVGAEPEGMPWHETEKLARLSPEAWDLLGGHVWSGAVGTGIAAILVTVGFGASDRLRQKLQLPLMGGLLFAAVAMGWGAHYGGEMVYRHGIGVSVAQAGQSPDTQSSTSPAPTESATTTPSAPTSSDSKGGIERAIPPLQLHLTLAGLAAALGFAALGMSIRVLSTADEWRDPEVSHAHNMLDHEAGSRTAGAPSPDADAGHGPAYIPSARFWLLTSLAALLTALAAYWLLAVDVMGTWKPQRIWEEIAGKPRRLYHAVVGASIIVLPLLLALAARFARHSKLVLGVLATLMIVALGLQTWLGVLLMFDTADGKVTGFNAEPTPVAMAKCGRKSEPLVCHPGVLRRIPRESREILRNASG